MLLLHIQFKNESFSKPERKSNKVRMTTLGTSLAVQWLKLCISTAGGTGSIPGQGTKIPHAMQRGQKKNDNSLQF